jgi:hypothetical protein
LFRRKEKARNMDQAEIERETKEQEKLLAIREVLKAIIEGHLPPQHLGNRDFMEGVQVGIHVATQRFVQAIPENLREHIAEHLRLRYDL